MQPTNYTSSTTPEQIQQQQAEKKAKETAIVRISKYLDSDIVKARFQDVLGRGANSYIASVMVAVRENYALQECHPESIYVSALRAAALRLSVDPSIGQAYLVPYAGKCTLQVGYKGLHDMAVRTTKYRYINVGPIYEGQVIEENQITGFHTISGSRQGNKIIGWLGAFELNPERGYTTGYGKTFYMTVEEIHEHAKHYSKTYGKKDKRGNPTIWQIETPKMERKTVLRLMLRRWGYLDPSDAEKLNEIESEEEAIDATASDVYDSQIPPVPEYDETAEEQHRTTQENIEQLGFS